MKSFSIHLRHIIYDVYLPSLSVKSTFKIIHLGGYVLRPDLKKNLIRTTKNVKKNVTVH